VGLTRERWLHILDRHRELRIHRDEILTSVALPDKRLPGREAGEEWFYRRGVGPTLWLKVVVHYEGGEGVILTAFPRRSFP
jgi:hypothetical protein